MQVGCEDFAPLFDFVTIIPHLVVPSVGLSVEMDFVFDDGTGLLVANSDVQTLPNFVVGSLSH